LVKFSSINFFGCGDANVAAAHGNHISCHSTNSCLQHGKVQKGGYNHWTGLLDWTTGLDYWTGLLDWTTGLTQTAKYNSFSAEQKLNVLISSVTSHCSLQGLSWSFQRSKVTCIFQTRTSFEHP